jgi:deazaflavin-dependent oxidoreductase (nitroreductase family)
MPQSNYIHWVPKPKMIKRIGKLHALLYRSTSGIIGGRVDGLDMLLLTTTGRKTGLARCVPLPYFRADSSYLLVASFGGNPKNPAWYANLVANHEVKIQLGAHRWSTRARVAEGAERDRLWSDITGEYPRYLAYQTKTSRSIPVIVIERELS